MIPFSFLSTAASHLQTCEALEDALKVRGSQVAGLIIESKDFYRWDSTRSSYGGALERVCWKAPSEAWVERRMLKSFPLARLSLHSRVKEVGNHMRGRGIRVALLAKDYGWPEYAYTLAARALGIPVVALQEGPLAREVDLSSHLLLRKVLASVSGIPRFPVLNGEGGAELFLASSEDYSLKFRENRRSRTNIEVVGLPRYDPLSSRIGGSSSNQKRLLFVTTPILTQRIVRYSKFEDILMRTALYLDRASEVLKLPLEVRPHPGESRGESELLRRKVCSPLKVSDPKQTFLADLRESDFVVGWYSNCLIEATILGNPTSYVEDGLWDADLKKLGIPKLKDIVESPDRLGKSIVDRSALLAEVGEIDGSSGERAIHKIEKFLETR